VKDWERRCYNFSLKKWWTITKVIKGKKIVVVVIIIDLFCEESGGYVKVRVLWRYTKEKTKILSYFT